MAYQPVQRNAGEIMYNAAMRRAQTLGGAFDTAVNTMYERQEENKAFNSKLKALESMIQTHSTKFGMDPTQLKQFLAVNPNESPKERYLRIGGFFEGTIKAAELQKMQLANQKAQTEIDQLKKLGEIYASFGAPTSQAPAAGPAPAPAVPATAPAGTPPPTGKYRRVDGSAPVTPAAPAPGTSEMSLLNSLRRFSPQQDTGYGMVGAEPFRLPSQMAAPAAPTAMAAPAAPAAMATPAAPAAASAMTSPAPATPTQPAPQAAAPAAEQPAGEGIPRPKIPSWYETLKTPMEIAAETAGAPGEMDLSPEAQAIARQLREQYEASLPVEEGKAPKEYVSAAKDTTRRKKTITLDAEGIKAILSDPRILVQSFADVAGDAYQQGLRRETMDRIMREQEQLRNLERMMRSRRAR